jgi:hypothetical protein
MSYELVHENAYGEKDVQTFADLDEVREEIDRLDGCLDEASIAQSYYIRCAINSLQEIIAENSPDEDQ